MDAELFNFGLRAFVTLLAVVDPLGNVLCFIAATRGSSPGRRVQIAWEASLTAAGVLVLFAFGGMAVLRLFNLTIPAVRISGGIILLIVALKMVAGWQFDWQRQPPTGTADWGAAPTGVAPLGIPLMAGPAAISSVIVLTAQGPDLSHLVVVLAAVVLVCAFSLLCYLLALPLTRRLGRSAILVISALMGLILAALAVQFMLDGLREAVPAWFAQGG